MPEAETQAAPFRILVVEDDVLIRVLLADHLRAAGLFVIEAGQAEEALSYIQAGEPIDLVFSDILMPGALNGLQLAQRIRDAHPLLPIILASGVRDWRGLDGLAVFVSKPYNLERAVELVLQSLKPKPAEISEPPTQPDRTEN